MNHLQNNTWIIGVESNRNKPKWDINTSLNELSELAKTAGLKVKGRTTQSREHPHPGYYLGNGKAKELKDTLPDTIHIIISDDELSPLQH